MTLTPVLFPRPPLLQRSFLIPPVSLIKTPVLGLIDSWIINSDCSTWDRSLFAFHWYCRVSAIANTYYIVRLWRTYFKWSNWLIINVIEKGGGYDRRQHIKALGGFRMTIYKSSEERTRSAFWVVVLRSWSRRGVKLSAANFQQFTFWYSVSWRTIIKDEFSLKSGSMSC